MRRKTYNCAVDEVRSRIPKLIINQSFAKCNNHAILFSFAFVSSLAAPLVSTTPSRVCGFQNPT
jgi:hypothetical protein